VVKSPVKKSPAKTPKPQAAAASPATATASSGADGVASPSKAKASAGATPAPRKIPAFVFGAPKPEPPMRGKKDPPPAGARNCFGYGGGGNNTKKKLGETESNTNPLTFVFTGTLDSLLREEAEDLVKRYGARVTGAVSSKTDYLVTGLEPSNKKIEAAQKHEVKVIDEDGLFDLIRQRSAGKTTVAPAAGTKPAGDAMTDKPSHPAPATATAAAASSASPPSTFVPPAPKRAGVVDTELWVDKHKPQTADEIVGNTQSVKVLINFLETWASNFLGQRPTNSPKAVLISGAPGIGKSTAAALCAKAAGFEVLEFNASDVRNKASIQEEVGAVLDNRALSEFFQRGDSQHKRKPHKLVIVMDEVDGMSSSDRGGMQELISCIKESKTPIICICNDASSPKVKSLKRYTLDITWRRPTPQQILPRLMQIAEKEGMKIDRQAMLKLIESVRADLRQAINTLQMWSMSGGVVDYDTAKQRTDANSKDFDKSPFEVAREFFRPPAAGSDWIGDRLNDYFVDSDLIPLFIQDSYLTARPMPFSSRPGAEPDFMGTFAHAADLIAEGDNISQALRSEQNWSIMPLHGVVSTIAPGAFLGGGLQGAMFFPTILGKMSTMGKNARLMAQMREVLSLDTTLSNKALALEYLPLLRTKLLKPLIDKPSDEGVSQVIEVMTEYGLTKSDWDVVMELTENLSSLKLDQVDSSVKSALTRRLNKEPIVLKVSRTGLKEKFKPTRDRAAKTEEEEEEAAEHVNEADDEEEDDEESVGKGKGKNADPMVQQIAVSDKKKTAPKGKGSKGGDESSSTRRKTASRTGGRSKRVIDDDDDDDDD